MNDEFSAACRSALQLAGTPLTLPQLAAAMQGGKKPTPKFTQELLERLRTLPKESGIFEWPKRGQSILFSDVSLRAATEDAFLTALAKQPLTVGQAAKPVSKLLRKVSEKRALVELRVAAPSLAAQKRVLQIAVNRQTVVYLSFAYLGNLQSQERAQPETKAVISTGILHAVARLQSGPGNYVGVDLLRHASELVEIIDNAALSLAMDAKLILARYDGPRPIPDDEKWCYIHDERGEIYIGAAIPREERMPA